jgi:hypothetical protein
MSSTRHPKADARVSAAAAEGISRSISIALMPARERPVRCARSSWDHPLRRRSLRTRFSSLGRFAMIVSGYDTLVAGSSAAYKCLLRDYCVFLGHDRIQRLELLEGRRWDAGALGLR